ncbi:MAG: peptidase A26, partial [bacterium]
MNYFRKLFFIIFLVVLGITVWQINTVLAFAGGTGTSGDPYQITTCTELQDMGSYLTSFFILNNAIDCTDTSTWNAGAGFVPVGTLATKFTGGFNGAGYVIDNLFISRSTTDYVGLFGYVDGTDVEYIKDVGLTDVN